MLRGPIDLQEDAARHRGIGDDVLLLGRDTKVSAHRL